MNFSFLWLLSCSCNSSCPKVLWIPAKLYHNKTSRLSFASFKVVRTRRRRNKASSFGNKCKFLKCYTERQSLLRSSHCMWQYGILSERNLVSSYLICLLLYFKIYVYWIRLNWALEWELLCCCKICISINFAIPKLNQGSFSIVILVIKSYLSECEQLILHCRHNFGGWEISDSFSTICIRIWFSVTFNVCLSVHHYYDFSNYYFSELRLIA